MKKRTCPSCRNRFSGYYCNICGEKVVLDEDLTMRQLLNELVNAVTFADSKLWRTLKLGFYPGTLSKNWIAGVRVRYMKPISVFFLANLIYFIFPIFQTYNTTLSAHMSSSPQGGLVTKMVEQKLENSEVTLETYRLKYDAKTTELSKLLLLLMVLFMSFFCWLIHTRKQVNYTHHFIFSLELMTFLILICLQVVGLLFYLLAVFDFQFLTETVLNFTIPVIIMFPLWKGERIFYQRTGFFRFLNAGLMLIGLIVSTFLYRILLFFLTFFTIS